MVPGSLSLPPLSLPSMGGWGAEEGGKEEMQERTTRRWSLLVRIEGERKVRNFLNFYCLFLTTQERTVCIEKKGACLFYNLIGASAIKPGRIGTVFIK